MCQSTPKALEADEKVRTANVVPACCLKARVEVLYAYAVYVYIIPIREFVNCITCACCE